VAWAKKRFILKMIVVTLAFRALEGGSSLVPARRNVPMFQLVGTVQLG
jgi:hypothetical protein